MSQVVYWLKFATDNELPDRFAESSLMLLSRAVFAVSKRSASDSPVDNSYTNRCQDRQLCILPIHNLTENSRAEPAPFCKRTQTLLVVPWAELVALIVPHAPMRNAKGGRPAFAVQTMLHIHFLQQWFNLSDPAMEEALYDTPMFRVVCAVQPVDGAQADAEHGGTGMSAPEMGKKAMKGAENAPAPRTTGIT